MENNLSNYQNFFYIDFAIKNNIYNLAPRSYMSHDEIIEYADKLYDSLKSFQNRFLEICQMFNMSEDIIKAVYDFISKIREKIVNTNYTEQDLKEIYNSYFASISEKNLKEIRKNIYGDSTVYNDFEHWILVDIINEFSSFNELLLFFHSYVTNNLNTLRSIPEISYKNTSSGSLSLRGLDNELGRKIYELLEELIYKGTADIVVINEDKVLITVRDCGHALQIETERKNEQEIGVYYFIPKVLVPEMISNLKGINAVKEDNLFAFGSFVTNPASLPMDIYEVVKAVPTDIEYMNYRRMVR